MSAESLTRRDPSLVTLNETHGIISNDSSDRNKLKLIESAIFETTPETIIDNESRRLIQLHLLHQSIAHTRTVMGSATLYRSLLKPPTSLIDIVNKQDSVKELQANDKLASSIEHYLQEIQSGEAAIFRFLNRGIDHRLPHKDFNEAMKSGKTIHDASKAIPQPETSYCKKLVEQIKGFNESTAYQLMRGPIYRTLKGLKSKEDMHFYTAGFRFRPSFISGGTILTPIIAAEIGYYAGIIPELILIKPEISLLIPYFLLSIPINKINLDNKTAINPLRNQIVLDETFNATIDAVGRLDELQSFVAFSREFPHPTVLPTITDNERHHFTAKDLRNPVLAKTNAKYVPNDVDLRDPLTFITGPNSGGKSTLSKSIVQNQILAQIGSPIGASEATVNITDYIAIQAPKYDSLHDDHGRFGTEMQRTKLIFDNISPRSLVILDELSEGTTREEKRDIARDLLEDIKTIGCTTIIPTHNHELVTEFQQQGNGHFLQVEFKDDDPTHKIIPGISTISHAERVLHKIEFTKEDRDRHLKQRGYR